MRMRFTLVLEPCDEGGYSVYVPSLPGCISEGDTRDEALANIRDAIALYLSPVYSNVPVDNGQSSTDMEGIDEEEIDISDAELAVPGEGDDEEEEEEGGHMLYVKQIDGKWVKITIPCREEIKTSTVALIEKYTGLTFSEPQL